MLICISSTAKATEIEKCATIADPHKRLSCYDALAGRPQITGAETSGNWNIARSKNPLDDSETVVASLAADKGQSRWGQPVVFVARCKSDTTDVYVNFSSFLGDDSDSVYEHWKYVKVRVGGGTVRNEKWLISTDSQAAFSNNPIGLLREMLSHRQLVIQVTPYQENPVTAIFKLDGIRKALEPLSKTCHWSSVN